MTVSNWFTMKELRSRVVVTEAGCWEWVGSKDRKGYAQARRFGKLYIISRVVLSLQGKLKLSSGRKQCALHRCDNPPCINPEHLFIGTYQDNADDKVKKGRHYHGDRHWTKVKQRHSVATT